MPLAEDEEMTVCPLCGCPYPRSAAACPDCGEPNDGLTQAQEPIWSRQERLPGVPVVTPVELAEDDIEEDASANEADVAEVGAGENPLETQGAPSDNVISPSADDEIMALMGIANTDANTKIQAEEPMTADGTTTCPTCGWSYPSNAEACPNCGEPNDGLSQEQEPLPKAEPKDRQHPEAQSTTEDDIMSLMGLAPAATNMQSTEENVVSETPAPNDGEDVMTLMGLAPEAQDEAEQATTAPEPIATQEPEADTETEPEVVAEAAVAPEPEPMVTPEPEPIDTPEPEPEIAHKPEPTAVSGPEVIQEPEPETVAEPVAEPETGTVAVSEPEPIHEREAETVAEKVENEMEAPETAPIPAAEPEADNKTNEAQAAALSAIEKIPSSKSPKKKDEKKSTKKDKKKKRKSRKKLWIIVGIVLLLALAAATVLFLTKKHTKAEQPQPTENKMTPPAKEQPAENIPLIDEPLENDHVDEVTLTDEPIAADKTQTVNKTEPKEVSDEPVAPKKSVSPIMEEKFVKNPSVKPQFPGGKAKLETYIFTNMRSLDLTPGVGRTGTVYVQFIVERNGAISNVKIERGVGGDCDAEAIRLVRGMPRWTPARDGGRVVRAQHILPIDFKLYR